MSIIEQKKINIYELCFTALSLIASIRVFFVANDGTWFLCLELIVVCVAFFCSMKIEKNIAILLGICIISLVITLIKTKSGFGLCTNYLILILSCVCFNKHPVSLSTYKKIHFIIAICSTVLILSLNMAKIYSSVVYSYRGMDLNTNTVGILSLAALFHWYCILDVCRIRSFTKTISALLISIYFIYQIWTSGCRSAIGAIILFAILFFVKRTNFKNTSFCNCVRWLLFASVVFTILYVALDSYLTNSTLLGKTLFSGRQFVWRSTWNAFLESPIWGWGTSRQVGTSILFDSCHNTVLSFAFGLGTIPTVIFIMLLGKKKDDYSGECLRISQITFISCLVVCFFESFLSGGYFCLLFLTFLVGVKNEKYDHDTNNHPLLLVWGKS